MEEKIKANQRNNLIYLIICLICVGFAVFALYNIVEVQEECNQYWKEYINKSCICTYKTTIGGTIEERGS